MAIYKVIESHTDEGMQGSVPTNLTFNVGETFEGKEENGVVYTLINKTMPEDVWSGKIVGASFFSIPLSKVETLERFSETHGMGLLLAPKESGMSNNQKWMWVVGLTLAAWGLFYWSQKEK